MEQCNCKACNGECDNSTIESLFEEKIKIEAQKVIEVTEQELLKTSASKRLSEIQNWICGTRDDGLVIGELDDVIELLSGVASLAEQVMDSDSKQEMSETLGRIAELLY